MSCQKCGRPNVSGLCLDCERDERRESNRDLPDYGWASDTEETDEHEA